MQIAVIKHNFSTQDVCIDVDDSVKINNWIVVENMRGLILAKVVKMVQDAEIDSETKYIRVATDKDIEDSEKLIKQANNIKPVVLKLLNKNNPDMKLVDIQYTLDNSKVVISFVCEDRVDFRDLVKDLANELKTRIELRQVGVRDQAKKVGCLGICGKECCCKQYLNDFDKVSIKMAKSQNLSLNPTKISGTCGRLMCCLAFENDTYVELGKNCPKQNGKVITPDGKGTVLSNNILKQTSLCRVEKGEDIKIAEYSVKDLKQAKDNQ